MNVLKSSKHLIVLLLSLLGLATAVAQSTPVGDGGSGPYQALHLKAQLLSAGTAVAPGGTLQLGLSFAMEDHWHVYWINSGDAGMPPKMKWALPDGVTSGPLQFAVPSRLPLGTLTDFGYNNNAVFPVTLTVAKDAKPGKIHVGGVASWLVCREVCIPGKANLGMDVTIAAGAVPPAPTGPIADALAHLPKALPSGAAITVHGGGKEFVVVATGLGTPSKPEFYPYEQEQIANAAPQPVEAIANGVQLRIPRAPEATALPGTMHGLLKINDTTGYEFTTAVVPGEVTSAAGNGPDALTVLPAIGLAFLGGIILNLMPCVFPVLFLKGLALVQSSSEERGRLRSHGLVYTFGILASFWVIVGVLLALRAGGSQAGWGFQLQSPTFIAVLACGLFFFALSLAGQFELGLTLTSVGGDLAQKQGYAGSFFTGVLATIVATPCTAPLMGAAIGYALAQPPLITFSVFTALALGLALPYLALSFQPAWVRILPRPGAWMETLKQLTAVPLFLTVIWLGWVYGRLFGQDAADHIARLLVGLLVLAIAGWTMGRWPARRTSTIAAVVLAVIALVIPIYQPKDTNLAWAPYSQSTLDAARAQGHPVFIDFTAAWCLSCQVNERLVLHSKDVEKQLRDRNVVLLKADWTQYDPEITKQLSSVGRSGVPTYVIYPASTSKQPDVLPELLTKDLVLSAIRDHSGA